MIPLFSLEFLIAVLFIIDVFLVISLLLFARRVNQRVLQMNRCQEHASIDVPSHTPEDNRVFESAREILDLLEPLVKESRRAALSFDEQIREKRKLSKDLNDALDTRIISINLLLSRAAGLQKKLEDREQATRPAEPVFNAVQLPKATNVLDQQNQIIDLYYQRKDVDTIAEKLSIPKGEVQLVIDLKEKFIAMEKG
jgi:hypothetical protein